MYPQLLTLILFGIVIAFTPGPNNIMASHSGFNFGFRRTAPLMLGVIFGWTALLISMEAGLILVFKKFEILQSAIKILGSFFLVYLSYKIAFSKSSDNENIKQPIGFIDTFLFQFINPKGVVVAMITVSTFVDAQLNYLRDSIVVTTVYFFMAAGSITAWCLIGKYLRKFATSEKFIKNFNYTMSFLLIVCVILFYV